MYIYIYVFEVEVLNDIHSFTEMQTILEIQSLIDENNES